MEKADFRTRKDGSRYLRLRALDDGMNIVDLSAVLGHADPSVRRSPRSSKERATFPAPVTRRPA